MSEQTSESLEEPVCQRCGGAGVFHPRKADGKPDYSQVVPCSCREEAIHARLLKQCTIPEELQHCTFENFDVFEDLREAYDAALALAEEDEAVGIRWLTLTGAWDRGKTHLAVAICQRWLQRGKPAKYAYVPILLDELRQGFEVGAEVSYQERFEYYCQVPLLVLDDLDVQSNTSWVNEKLDTIVHYRGVRGLPLVITTNSSVMELPPRIASRVQRERFCKVVGIEAGEYRLRRKDAVDNS